MIFKTFEDVDGLGNRIQKVGLALGNFKFSDKWQERLKKIGLDDLAGIEIQNVKAAKQKIFDADLDAAVEQQKAMLKRYQAAYDEVFDSTKNNQAEATNAAMRATQDANDTFKEYTQTLNNGRGTMEGVEQHQRKMAKAAQDSQKGFAGLSKSTTAMLGNIGATMAITAAIQLAMAGISKLNDYFNITDSAKLEDMEAAIGDYNDAISKSRENISTLQGLEDEFNTLSKGVDENGRNVGLSAECVTFLFVI